MSLTKTEDLEEIPCESKSVVSQEKLATELPTLVTSMVHDALDQDVEELGDACAAANSRDG